MSKLSGDSDSRAAGATSSASVPASSVMATMADTTWRMFTPSVGLTLAGVWLDAQFGTKPWLMFGGIVLGFVGAFVLVKRQIAGGTRRKAAQR